MAFDVEGARRAGYSDTEIADFLGAERKFDLAGARSSGYSDAEIVDHLAAAHIEPSSLARRLVGDTAVSAAKGVVGFPQALVGWADIPTGGRVGKFIEEHTPVQFKQTQEALTGLYSPEQQQAFGEVAKAEGFIPTVSAAVRNPSTIVHSAIQSVPSMLGGAGVARGAISLIPGVAPVVAGAFGEGMMSAGATAEQAREDSPTGRLTAGQSALAAGSGALTGALGVMGGKLAQRLGIGDIDTLLAGGVPLETKKGIVRRAIESALSEGALEELPQSAQERVASNLSAGRPWDEGVVNDAAQGLLAGMAMGAGGAYQGHPAVTKNSAIDLTRGADQDLSAELARHRAGAPQASDEMARGHIPVLGPNPQPLALPPGQGFTLSEPATEPGAISATVARGAIPYWQHELPPPERGPFEPATEADIYGEPPAAPQPVAPGTYDQLEAAGESVYPPEKPLQVPPSLEEAGRSAYPSPPGEHATEADIYDLDAAAHEAATSPLNDRPEPTEAQAVAGNYRKGHYRLYPGVELSIENPVGSTRSGTDEAGNAWEQELGDHYGYIKKTEGRDGDHVDIFVPEGFSPNSDEDRIFVVDQQNAKGKFDEHKVIAGAQTAEEARAIYLRNYDSSGPSRIMDITEMSVPEFKEWLKGDTTKRLSKRVSPTYLQNTSTGEDRFYRGRPAVDANTTGPWFFSESSSVAGVHAEANKGIIESVRIEAPRNPLTTSDITVPQVLSYGVGEERHALLEKLKAQGYDAVRYFDTEGDAPQVIVLDPSLIKREQQAPAIAAPEGRASVTERPGSLTPEALTRIREAIARSLPAAVRLETPATIGAAPPSALKAHGRTSGQIAGLHTVEKLDDGTLRDVIRLALDTATEETGYHELFHAAERLGVISNEDRAILNRRYPAIQKAPSETRADAYARWVTGDKQGIPAVVQRIFRQIQQFVERLRNALTGLGYRSAEDVFADLDSGKLANGDATNSGGSFSVGGRITTTTGAFKQWFGKSILVDANGDPEELYHGTADEVEGFDLDHPNRKDTGWLGTGVYLTDSPEIAGAYSNLKAGRGSPNVMPLYARLENPYYATTRDKQRLQLVSHQKGAEAGRAAADAWTAELKAKGHDGVILRYTKEEVGASASREVVVFDPAAVKSVFNRGTWDRSDARVSHAVRDDKIPMTQRLGGVPAQQVLSAIQRGADTARAVAPKVAEALNTNEVTWDQVQDTFKNEYIVQGSGPLIRKPEIGRPLAQRADAGWQALEMEVARLAPEAVQQSAYAPTYSLAEDDSPEAQGALSRMQEKATQILNRFEGVIASGIHNLPDEKGYLTKRYQAFGLLGEVKRETRRLWDTFSKLTADDAKAAFAYLTTKDATTEAITNRDLAHELEVAKRMIERIGDMLVKKRLLPEKVVDAHRGEYLPRFYLEFLIGKENLGKMAAGKSLSLGYTNARDWTKSIEERIARGEIQDPAYLISRAYSIPMRDMVILDWLTDLAKHSEWVMPGSLIEWAWEEGPATYKLGSATYRVNEGGTFDVTLAKRTPKEAVHEKVAAADLGKILGSEKIAEAIKAGRGTEITKKIGESPKAGRSQYQATGWKKLQHLQYKKDADGSYTVKVRTVESSQESHQGVTEDALAALAGDARAAAMLEHREVGHRFATISPEDWNAGIAKKYPVGKQVRGKPQQVGGQMVSAYWLASEADRIHKLAMQLQDGDERAMNLRTEARMRDLLAQHVRPDFDPKRWAEMPNGKRYGPLAGMIVRKEIRDDLVGNMKVILGEDNWVERLGVKMERANALWKWAKVTLNAAGQVRNAVSNAMIVGMTGTNWNRIIAPYSGHAPLIVQTLREMRAVKDGQTLDNHYATALQYGVSEASWSNTELMRIETELVEMLQREGKGGFPIAVKAFLGKLYNTTGDWYQNMEAFWKTLRIIDNMQNKGMSAQDAALDAHEVLIDYSLVPPWMKTLRQAPLGMPFLCVDDSTEVLTHRGWMTVDTVKVGDLAASMDLTTGRLLWKPIDDVYSAPYAGEMVHVKDRHLDMLMTPDHGVVTYRRRRVPGKRAENAMHLSLEVVHAKDITAMDHIPVAAPFDREPDGPSVPDAVVRVVGWYVTEGSVHRKCDCVFISQLEGAKARDIRQALTEAGMTWREWVTRKTGVVTFYIHARHGRVLRELCPNKQLTMEFVNRLTTHQIEILVATLLAGDGHTAKNGRRAFIQNQNETLNTFQAALTMIGLSWNVRPHGGATKAVLIKDGDRYCVKRSTYRERVQFEGRIWCPHVVDTGTWVARRAGKVFVTHNTYTLKILPVLAKAVVNHPAHSLPVMGLAAAMPWLIAASLDIDKDDYDKFMKKFPDWVQEKGHVYLWPVKGEDGRWDIVDVGYFFPWAAWTEALTTAGRAVKDQAPMEALKALGALGVGGAPLIDLIVAAKTGIDPFTQRPIADEFGTPQEKLASWLTYFYNMATPSMINLGGKGALGKAVDSITGEQDRAGRPKSSLAKAAGSLVGVNTYTYDPIETRERNLTNRKRAMEDTESAMKRRLANPNNAGDEAGIIKYYVGQIQRMADEMQQYTEESDSSLL